MIGAVAALVRALDAKDPETAQHSTRVGRLAESMARAMGLSPEFQRTLRVAGELHDVGKIGVPDELLRRPGRLSAAEHREVLEHTVIGERILSPLLPDRDTVLKTVRSHHERFDGKGFPDGLRGRAIPLAARIVAVADAFDAMMSARPYRESLGRVAALRELRRGAGTQFDPGCVRALLRALRPNRRLSQPRPCHEARSLRLISFMSMGSRPADRLWPLAGAGLRRPPRAVLAQPP